MHAVPPLQGRAYLLQLLARVLRTSSMRTRLDELDIVRNVVISVRDEDLERPSAAASEVRCASAAGLPACPALL